MDKDRDEILNDLIKYYDGDKNDNDTNDDQASGRTEESSSHSMGDTKIIPQKPEPQSDALGGDTIMVDINKNNVIHAAEETQHIGPVKDEVLGMMGLDGLPVDKNPTEEFSVETEMDLDTDYDEYSDNDNFASDNYYDDKPISEDYDQYDDENEDEEYFVRRHRGIWFSLKPLWITLILSGVLAASFGFYMTDTGIIGTYKRNFEYNMNMLLDMLGIGYSESITEPISSSDNTSTTQEFEDEVVASSEESSGTQQSGEIRDNVRDEIPSQYTVINEARARLPFVEADNSEFAVYGSGIVCAKSNYLCLYNNSGVMDWEMNTDIQNPILKTAGDYIAIASKDGTKLSLYKNNTLQFSTDSADRIISCNVSERGDVVLVTERSAYKGAVAVINRRGEEIFSWASGVNYITSASILKTRLVAVSLVNAESNVTSYLMVFDIESPDPLSGVELTGTLLFDVFNNGNRIYTIGDNSISSMNEYCEMEYDKRFDDASMTHTANDSKGNRLISYTIQNIPALNVYNKNGDLICTLTIDNNPDFISIYGTTVLYNNGRDIICGKATKEEKSLYTAPMDIKDLILINNKTYLIVYENSIEFVKI